MQELSIRELVRYSRHFNLDQVGLDGQKKLKASSVLLVGAGGLGSPLALYLAAAGVGRLGLIDFDVVDETNLQRQVLHGTASIGKPKLESARRRLSDLNPHVSLELHQKALDASNALDLFKDYDVVADGADNFATRYLVNDACVLSQTPLVSGSILGFEGQLSVFNYQGGPCYRCLFPEPPPPGSVPSCAEGGVLGVLPGVIGSLQANEVLKILLGIGEVAAGRLLLYDALALSFDQLKIQRDSHCALCGDNPSIDALIDYQHFCGLDKEEGAVVEIGPRQLADQLKQVQLIDVRETYEREICRIEPSQHVPLVRLTEFNHADGRPLVAYCRSGVRSARAVRTLQQLGFQNVSSLAGGILRWIDEIDPSQLKY